MKKNKPKPIPTTVIPPTHEELIAFIEGWDLVKPGRVIDNLKDKE